MAQRGGRFGQDTTEDPTMSTDLPPASQVPDMITDSPLTSSSSAFVISVPLQIIYYLIGSVGVFGNTVTIIIIFFAMDVRKSLTNALILNQSTIDLCCSVFLIATTLFSDVERRVDTFADLVYCKVWLTKGPLWGCFTSSSFNLMNITLERFVAIKFPIWYKTSITNTKVLVASLLAWVFGSFVMIGYGIASTVVIDSVCNVYVANSALGFMVVSVQYFIPIIVFIGCYWQMYLALRFKVSPPSSDHQKHKVWKRSRNIMLTLFKVVVCFVFCWSWNQLYYFFYLLNVVTMDFTGVFYHFTVVAVFCNCCCNPFVYALSYKNFRTSAIKLFTGNRVSSPSTSNSNASKNQGIGKVSSSQMQC